jgi:hypothetical protein
MIMSKYLHEIKPGEPLYWQTADYQNRLLIQYREQIKALAISRYRWIGLPDNIDQRYLETTLLYQGQASIAKPRKRDRFYATQCAYQGILDINDNPVRWQCLSNQRHRFHADVTTGVFIFDNLLRINITNWIELQARELLDIQQTMQINRLHQKVPYIITGPQEKKQDMLNLYRMIATGEPAIIANDSINLIKVDVLDVKQPYIGEELEAAWRNQWNNIYTMLGIKNLPFKAERQVADEIEDQSHPTQLASMNGLITRRQAAKRLNKLFGLDVKVVERNDEMTHNYNLLNDLTQQEDYKNDSE